MSNILRMDFYRMLRSKSLWVCLGIMIVITILSMAMYAFMTSPDFMQLMQSSSANSANMNIESSGNGALSNIETPMNQLKEMLSQTSAPILTGKILVSGGSLGMLLTIFLSLFYASEFESGFAKNVFTTQANRLAFLGARLVEILVLVLCFILIGLAVVCISAPIGGLKLADFNASDAALWVALLTLVMCGFCLLTTLIVWLTRKLVAGILVAVLIASGMVTGVIGSVLGQFPTLSHVIDYTLYACTKTLAAGFDTPGSLSVLHLLGVSIAFIAIYGVLCGVVLRKKDI